MNIDKKKNFKPLKSILTAIQHLRDFFSTLKRKKGIAIIQGFIMGIANIIPGISGGTLALVMGIYTKFIQALNDISKWITSLLRFLLGFNKEKWNKSKKNFKKVDWFWVIFLFLGRGLAILFVSRLIKFLLDNYPSLTYGAFFGLILASVIIPLDKMEKKGIRELIAFIIAFILLFWFSGLEAFETTMEPALWLLLVSGIVATSAMILPGISGSFLLVMLGVHSYIFGLATPILKGQILTTNVIFPLLLYGIGWLTGILSFSRLLNVLLKKYHSVTMAFLIGLMLGSLRKIYPFLNTSNIVVGTRIEDIPKIMPWEMKLEYLLSMQFIGVAICIIAGILSVSVLHLLSKKYTKFH